jgi:hypothetical protein
MKQYKCTNIETNYGPYNSCVVSVPDIEPTGNMSLDKQTLIGEIMGALDVALDADVERFETWEEVNYAA